MDRTHRRRRAVAGAVVAVTLLGISIFATVLRPDFIEEPFVSGLTNPTAMAFAPDGRLFVCQQGGQLRVIDDGVLLPTPFTTVTVNSSGERGLLGVAFDPQFATNSFVYVYYTATTPTIHNRVSRFTANGNVAATGETILLELNTLSGATNHNGGAMHFGPDGRLYIAVGDNAFGDNAQMLTNLLGKMLRINKDGTIPGDNPFVSQADGVNEAIWAIGLRNPFTFAFEPGSNRMFINDVGQNTWEEINEGVAGANYGWPATEGTTTNPAYRSPIYSYPHTNAMVTGCAITGGTFYSGVTQIFPASYAGDYFFADYCSGWINHLDETRTRVTPTFATEVAAFPVDLKAGPDGALYYLSRVSGGSTGVVRRIVFAGSQAPSISTHPQNVTTSVGQSATFTVEASGSTPLSYQWQRNGTPISGATSSTYTLPNVAPSDSGSQFRVVVSNPLGSITSDPATLTVTGNGAPVPTILTPAASFKYTAGTVLNFSGSATDPEQGTLPGTALTWKVDFHHDTHTHPTIQSATGTSGSFLISDTDETSANVWFKIHLTATDAAGQTATTFRDVLPVTTQITLTTSPSGFQLTRDGLPIATPVTFAAVAGVRRQIGAPSPQNRQSGSYEFRSWSDGGAQTHMFVTPSVPTTFSATYRKARR